MIPDIGLMIGAYIFTRMADLANTSGSKAIRILAALTMFLTVAMMADLVLRGTVDIGLGDLAK